MPRVVHFEIPADDPERAADFYRRALGWEISKWEGPVAYWLVTTGPDDEPGINGAIKHRVGDIHTQNTIAVPSYEEFAQKVVEAGGKVITEKMAIPGIGYHGYCQDTEGNVFGIMEEDPSAK